MRPVHVPVRIAEFPVRMAAQDEAPLIERLLRVEDPDEPSFPVALAAPDLLGGHRGLLELDGEPAGCEHVSAAASDRYLLGAVGTERLPSQVPGAFLSGGASRLLSFMSPVMNDGGPGLGDHDRSAVSALCAPDAAESGAVTLSVNQRLPR